MHSEARPRPLDNLFLDRRLSGRIRAPSGTGMRFVPPQARRALLRPSDRPRAGQEKATGSLLFASLADGDPHVPPDRVAVRSHRLNGRARSGLRSGAVPRPVATNPLETP